ncbi:hypothetical protein PHJA_003005300, partial [Phtheirospermum japonicum]
AEKVKREGKIHFRVFERIPSLSTKSFNNSDDEHTNSPLIKANVQGESTGSILPTASVDPPTRLDEKLFKGRRLWCHLLYELCWDPVAILTVDFTCYFILSLPNQAQTLSTLGRTQFHRQILRRLETSAMASNGNIAVNFTGSNIMWLILPPYLVGLGAGVDRIIVTGGSLEESKEALAIAETDGSGLRVPMSRIAERRIGLGLGQKKKSCFQPPRISTIRPMVSAGADNEPYGKL